MYFSPAAPVCLPLGRVGRGHLPPTFPAPCLGHCAGTGKSRVLEAVLSMLPASTTYATAPTGVAACVIGGTTLHAFAGLGRIPAGASVAEAAERVRRNVDAAMRWRSARALVVDEVSMLPAGMFDLLDGVARSLRGSRCEQRHMPGGGDASRGPPCSSRHPIDAHRSRSPSRPFGGIQLVLCGDFFQLPPVTRSGETCRLCFESEAWSSAVQATVVLRRVFRQTDGAFAAALDDVRTGALSEVRGRKTLCRPCAGPALLALTRSSPAAAHPEAAG